MLDIEIINKIKNQSTNKVKIAIADIDGILRGKYIHKDKFLDSVEKGFGFCDVIFGWDSGDKCYENTKITGWHTGYPDGRAKIDLQTFRTIPWENGLPFFIADFSDDPKYNKVSCSRSLLKRIADDCLSLGFKAIFSQEFEWFNFSNTPSELYQSNFQELRHLSPGMFGYSILRSSLNNPYFNDLFEMLQNFNIPLEGLHTETGPGVLEATIIYDEILQAADKAVLFKSAVKEIAYKHNIMATFMAKINSKLPGCGGHIHQSLWNNDKSENLFYNHNKPEKLSPVMEHYLAGLLTCMPEIMPMYAPTVNSYKRIGHGDWAPATVTWGFDNRTTSARVIQGEKNGTRIEFRVPGADMNPYLSMAASLASGLYGIRNSLKLNSGETVGNGYEKNNSETLPSTLSEATSKMKTSKIARELFGDSFVDHFCATREWECKQFNDEVTDWELKRYFEII